MKLYNVMSTYELKGTKTTPTVQFDAENGYLLLEGKSSPENSVAFYSPLFEAIQNASQKDTFKVDVKLIYFNTSTVRCLNLLFKIFTDKKDNGSQVTINWFAEDDDLDMIEMGEDFEEISELPFNYITMED